MLPIVVTQTTLNAQVIVSLTWRNSVFSQAGITAFTNDLLEEIRSWMSQRLSSLAYEPAA
jgi:hypothetical protein